MLPSSRGTESCKFDGFSVEEELRILVAHHEEIIKRIRNATCAQARTAGMSTMQVHNASHLQLQDHAMNSGRDALVKNVALDRAVFEFNDLPQPERFKRKIFYPKSTEKSSYECFQQDPEQNDI